MVSEKWSLPADMLSCLEAQGLCQGILLGKQFDPVIITSVTHILKKKKRTLANPDVPSNLQV